jgi:glycosyltransferase involved in cell wall biosynthesis
VNSNQLVSVIIPVFDERNTVGEVVRRVRNLELPIDTDLEIIVVDDGSTDGTDKVLRAIEDSTVRVIRHSENRGQGAAVRTGLEYVRGQVIVIQDADLEYDPSDIPSILQPIIDRRADVVFGSRFQRTRPVMSLTSMLMDRTVSLAASLLYNTTLTDLETGYRAFDADALRTMRIESDGFEFGPEITAKLLRGGKRIMEIPVSYSGRTSGRKFRAIDRLHAVATLARYRFRARDSLLAPTEVIDLREAEQSKLDSRNEALRD